MVPYGITMVQADQLLDTHAASRKICIIDSGYDLAHEETARKTWVPPGVTVGAV